MEINKIYTKQNPGNLVWKKLEEYNNEKMDCPYSCIDDDRIV